MNSIFQAELQFKTGLSQRILMIHLHLNKIIYFVWVVCELLRQYFSVRQESVIIWKLVVLQNFGILPNYRLSSQMAPFIIFYLFQFFAW